MSFAKTLALVLVVSLALGAAPVTHAQYKEDPYDYDYKKKDTSSYYYDDYDYSYYSYGTYYPQYSSSYYGRSYYYPSGNFHVPDGRVRYSNASAPALPAGREYRYEDSGYSNGQVRIPDNNRRSSESTRSTGREYSYEDSGYRNGQVRTPTFRSNSSSSERSSKKHKERNERRSRR
jgi:hypothetical protein